MGYFSCWNRQPIDSIGESRWSKVQISRFAKEFDRGLKNEGVRRALGAVRKLRPESKVQSPELRISECRQELTEDNDGNKGREGFEN